MSDSAGTSRDSARQRRPRTHLMCFFRWVAILNMLNEAAGRTFFSFASGVMVRPLLSLFFLMYAQSAFTTSVRAILFLPQIAARSAESVLVARSPMPFFFIAAAFFLPAAFDALLLWTPFGRLPPGYFTTFFFFFFFFLAFFFFFFFLAFFFLADVCCVRARVALVISFFTLPVSTTTIASSGSMLNWGISGAVAPCST